MTFDPAHTTGARKTSNIYGYEPGSLLRVITKDSGFVEGYILEDPSESKTPDCMDIYWGRQWYANGGEDDFFEADLMRLSVDDIRAVTRIHGPEAVFGNRRRIIDIEKLLKTVVIDSVEPFRKLMEELKSGSVHEVGINIYGIFIGRDGKAGWISLNLENTLFNIDVLALQRTKDFWRSLNVALFSNKTIKKVMYNARPVVDYVYHNLNYPMKEVFDIQVADYMIWAYGQSNDKLKEMEMSQVYNPLSTILQLYLKYEVPLEEINLLKWFEKQDFTRNSPLMRRPVLDPKLCKCVAIEMKYLLTLRKILQEKLLVQFNECMTANMESLTLENNGIMETQLAKPLMVPVPVVERYISPIYNRKRALCVNSTVKSSESSNDEGTPKASNSPTFFYKGGKSKVKGKGRGKKVK